jgi:hypothetical protein
MLQMRSFQQLLSAVTDTTAKSPCSVERNEPTSRSGPESATVRPETAPAISQEKNAPLV